MLVTPFVVLLDNHTTNRKGEITESYGWKWENKPNENWQGYFANHLTLNGYDIRLKPFYYPYSGYVLTSSLHYAGARGYYWNTITTAPVKRWRLFIDKYRVCQMACLGFIAKPSATITDERAKLVRVSINNLRYYHWRD